MKEVIQKFFKSKYGKIGVAAVCVIAVLAAAFLLQPTPNRSAVAGTAAASSEQVLLEKESQAEATREKESQEEKNTVQAETDTSSAALAESQGKETDPAETRQAEAATAGGTSQPASKPAPGPQPTSSAPGTVGGSASVPETSPEIETEPETTAEAGKDPYLTDPVPEGKPQPVEPEETFVDEETQYTCTLSIRCDTILNNMDMLA